MLLGTTLGLAIACGHLANQLYIEAFVWRIHDRAAMVLTSEQMRRLDELLDEQLTRERMRLALLRAGAMP